MLRQIIKSNSRDIHISIPDEYVGKTLEILTNTIDEIKYEGRADHTDSIDNLYDSIRIDFAGFSFYRDEANSR